jgi:dolichol kinase
VASTYELETQDLSEDLCALLRRVDPSSYREDAEPETRASVSAIQARLRALVEAAEQDPHLRRLREGLQTLLATLERSTPEANRAPREAWTAFQKEVQPAYEALAQGLRSLAVPVPSVRPTNYTRSLFHVFCGVSAFSLLRFLPGRSWLIGLSLSFAVAAWTMEIARRRSDDVNERLMRLFGKVAHPHERYRINSSTWYTTALFLLALFAPMPAAELAVLVLAVADPAAALVGRRFGKTRLRAGRSLEGTVAFFAVGSAVSLGLLLALHPLALPVTLTLAVTAGLSGALAELYSTRLDDNFTIPVTVALAVGLVARFVVTAGF